jgi:hypothetical protein
VEVAFVLEEIQVPPGLGCRVVDGEVFFSAARAGESSSAMEVHVDVQFAGFFVKRYFVDEYGGFYPQRRTEYFFVHLKSPPLQKLYSTSFHASLHSSSHSK